MCLGFAPLTEAFYTKTPIVGFWILSYSAFDPLYHFTPLQLAAILYLAILIVTLVFRARAPCPCWRATNKKHCLFYAFELLGNHHPEYLAAPPWAY